MTYTINVRNDNGQSSDEVTVEDSVDSGNMTIVDAGGGAVSGNTIRWSLGRLEGNGTRSFTYRLRLGYDLHQGDSIVNHVRVQGQGGARLSEQSAVLRIIEHLPQTGVLGSLLKPPSQYLREWKAGSNDMSAQAQQASSFTITVFFLTLIGMGVATGSMIAKQFLF